MTLYVLQSVKAGPGNFLLEGTEVDEKLLDPKKVEELLAANLLSKTPKSASEETVEVAAETGESKEVDTEKKKGK